MDEIKNDVIDMSGKFKEYTPEEFNEYMKTEDLDSVIKKAQAKREKALSQLAKATGLDIETLRLI